MIDLQPYLDMTTMMVLATKDTQWNPYTANVYFCSDQNNVFYFKSKNYREHSKHILLNNKVAWSIINTEKYDRSAPDKKWLQFQWIARRLEWKEAEEISKKMYNIERSYGDMEKEWHFIFACSPTQVKIWDEELFGWDGKKINL